MENFATRLSGLMIEKDISAQKLSSIIGVDKSTIHGWKRGTQVFLSNAIKLANFFECSLDYLMGRSDNDLNFTPRPCPPFYQHFRTALEHLGITAYRMRKESQITGAYFNDWKKGADPLMPTLIAAADYLDVTLDYLVGRET
ncbi:MAG: helix-turn-helix domain-containing protein [Firmicutes bacterium]|nr:helix-turn-helix domain-containing protein [Bacillota bacterium]